jgi:hypothetical protein
MADLPPITFCSRQILAGGGRQHYVASALEAAGCRVTTVPDGPLKVARDEVVFVMNNFSWFPRIRRQLAATPPARRPLVMGWQTEPLPLPSAAPFDRPALQLRELAKIVLRDSRATDVFTNYFHLRQLARSGIPDLLIVSTPSGREFLAEKGITSHWVPLGYHAALGRDLRVTRDIDVLFLGTPDDARHRQSVRYLKRKGVNVLAKGNWTDPACWGDERTKLINRANIFLGLQRRPGKLSGTRMILGMANKALVIAEPIYNSAPYVSGKHYISATLDTMPEVIDHYLRNDAERERITGEAYRFVNEEVTMERSVARIIGLLEQHWAVRLGTDMVAPPLSPQ